MKTKLFTVLMMSAALTSPAISNGYDGQPIYNQTWDDSTHVTNNNGATAGAVSGSNSSATGGNAAGGNATATGGRGGAGGNATQGQQQGQRQAANANNRISIDNSTRQAAAQAAPVIMGGYGPANCFGDTNPSGQFGASMQVFGWGVTANSNKASNVCAIAQLAGPAAAIGYLQKMDPNVPRAVTVMRPTGRVTCPATYPIYVEGKGCRK